MPTNKVFTFSVDENGHFTYDPAGDWAYHHKDALRFQTATGPFSLTLKRVDANPQGLGMNPLGGPHQAKLDPASRMWTVQIASVEDGLSNPERSTIFAANVPPGGNPKTDGFVARYRYALTVKQGGNDRMDESHNGEYIC